MQGEYIILPQEETLVSVDSWKEAIKILKTARKITISLLCTSFYRPVWTNWSRWGKSSIFLPFFPFTAASSFWNVFESKISTVYFVTKFICQVVLCMYAGYAFWNPRFKVVWLCGWMKAGWKPASQINN